MALTKRTLKSIATKERIRNTVMNLMRTSTLDQISVQEICTQAGVGIGTFYHYYKSKDDIVHDVYADLDAQFLMLAGEGSATDADPYSYILRHVICYARFMMQTNVDFVRKLFSLQSKVFLDQRRPIYSTLKAFLLDKQQRGAVSAELDVDRLCEYISIWMRGLTFDWCLHDGEYDLVKAAIDFLEPVLAAYRTMLGA